MGNVEHTHLPGVGDRSDFVTEAGERIGVVTMRDGRRELVFYDPRDTDRCVAVARLSEDDLRELAKLLDAS